MLIVGVAVLALLAAGGTAVAVEWGGWSSPTDTAGSNSGAAPLSGSVAVSPDGKRVYASSPAHNEVTVIGTLPAGARPTAVAVSPDGRRVYVANGASNTVTVLDAATAIADATFVTGMSDIDTLVADTTGHRLYLISHLTGVVKALDPATGAVLHDYGHPGDAGGVTVSPDGSRLYAIWGTTNSIAAVDSATGRDITTMPIQVMSDTSGRKTAKRNLTVSPDERRLYAADPGSDTVWVVDTARNQVVSRIDTGDGSEPDSVAASPDGKRIYIASSKRGKALAVDVTTGLVVGSTLQLGAGPVDAEVTSDGHWLYAITSSGVRALDTTTGQAYPVTT